MTGAVLLASTTALTVQFSPPLAFPGQLQATVTSFGLSSGAAVAVATVRLPPTVTQNNATLSSSATSLTIAGSGFDTSSPTTTTVALSLNGTTVPNTVVVSSSTSLTVTFFNSAFFNSALPTTGVLTALVSSFGLSSAAVQVATVLYPPRVTANSAILSSAATSLAISGTGFESTSPTPTTVALTVDGVIIPSSTFSVAVASPTSLSITFTSPPLSNSGELLAVVTSSGLSSAPTVVATVRNPPTVVQNADVISYDLPSLVILGTGFDATSTPTTTTVSLQLNGSSIAHSVTVSSSTSLTVSFSTLPLPVVGNLTALVTSFGLSSGSPVVVGNVQAIPLVTENTDTISTSATSLVITGTDFDTTSNATTTTVALTLNGTAVNNTVAVNSSTSLTVTFSSALPTTGQLLAVVKSFNVSSVQTQVATVRNPPTVAPNAANVAAAASSLVINGTGFDSTSPTTTTTVALTINGTRVPSNTYWVSVASPTSLTLSFTWPLPKTGSLAAVVTSFGLSSGAPVIVGNIIPSVTAMPASLQPITSTTLVITGAGFSTTAANNTVTLSNGAVGTVATYPTPTSTSLTVTLWTKPSAVGQITAIVQVNGVSSEAAVVVATVIPSVTATSASLQPITASTLIITGAGFSTTAANNTVTLSDGAAGTVAMSPAPTFNSITVSLTTAPTAVGQITAVVQVNGLSSGAAVAVATVVPVVTATPTNETSLNTTSLVITGAGFSTTAANNVVALSNGAVGTVATSPAPTFSSLTVTLTTTPTTIGQMSAVVQVSGVSSGTSVVVATVTSGLPTSATWRSVAVSDSGQKMTAVEFGGNIWLTSNGGLSWAAQTNVSLSAKNWVAVASNSDGTKIAAAEFGGSLWLSSDSGATWTSQPAGTGSNKFPGLANWNAVALSGAGDTVAAGASGGKLWRTAVFGGANGWNAQTGSFGNTTQDWASISSSTDGAVYSAGVDVGALFYSRNTNNTWYTGTIAPFTGSW